MMLTIIMVFVAGESDQYFGLVVSLSVLVTITR